jgi:hypothetical protein
MLLWVCVGLPVLRCCWFPRGIVAVNVGVLGLVAAGVSVYVVAVLAPHLRNGTCIGDRYEELCYRGLTKGIAVGCVRALVT